MAAREWNYRGEAGATRPSYTGPLGFTECRWIDVAGARRPGAWGRR